jgi:drug/metabolite transporter (DMT)-like permease
MHLLLAIIANVLWGTTFLASKHLLDTFSALEITFYRFALAALAILLWQISTNKALQWHLLKQNFFKVLALGLISYTGLYYFQIEALKYISTSYSAIIMLTSPIFAVLAANLLLKKQFILREYLLLLIAMGGGAILILDNYTFSKSIEPLGFVFTAISSLFLGLSLPLTKNLQNSVEAKNTEAYSPFNLTLHTMLIGTAVNLLLILPTVQTSFVSFSETTNLLWFGYLSLACSFFAFITWNHVIKHLSTSLVAITMYIKTPVAILLGIFLLNENISILFFLGSGLIVVSIYMQKRYEKISK